MGSRDAKGVEWRALALRALEWAPLIALVLIGLCFVAHLALEAASYVISLLSSFSLEALLAPLVFALSLGTGGGAAAYALGTLLLAAVIMASPRMGLFFTIAVIIFSAIAAFAITFLFALLGGGSSLSLGGFISTIFSLMFGSLAALCMSLLKWMNSNLTTIILIVLVMNGLGTLAMWLDKRQAQASSHLMSLDLTAWRLPERAIKRYAVAWGGLGVLAASLIFRHKTLHRLLIIQVAIYTVIAYTLLALAAGA